MLDSRLARTVAVVTVFLVAPAFVPAAHSVLGTGTVFAQAQGTDHGELSPRYEPVAPEPKSSYNSQYLFGMTRGVAESTVHPAVKVPLFVLTVPLDIVFLPFAAIGGFFG